MSINGRECCHTFLHCTSITHEAADGLLILQMRERETKANLHGIMACLTTTKSNFDADDESSLNRIIGEINIILCVG
jgi:hypothetical protein